MRAGQASTAAAHRRCAPGGHHHLGGRLEFPWQASLRVVGRVERRTLGTLGSFLSLPIDAVHCLEGAGR